jgi:hypothetical protein
MLGQPKHAAVVKPDPLKNAVAIQKAVVKYRYFGLGFRIKDAVDVNLHGWEGIISRFPAADKSGNCKPTNSGFVAVPLSAAPCRK